MVDRVNGSGTGVTFIVFWTPVNELSSAHISAFLLGRAIASEVSLFPTVETHTLYASLDSSILDSSYVSPLGTSSLSSPISS